MSVIIFIIILGVLIFVHELGHFLIAKKSGIRVDEFAIGFPPKIFSFKKGETKYALNLIPFGGYVKIFGESPDEESSDPNRTDSFVNKSKLTQASVLIAGILFNIIFAWLLFSISFMTGFPSVVTDETRANIKDASVVITEVIDDAPANKAGLQPSDEIVSLSNGENMISGHISIVDIQDFIAQNNSSEIIFEYRRDNKLSKVSLVPKEGIVEGKFVVGIAMDMIGSLQLPVHLAVWEGFLMTGGMLKDIALGLGTFIGQIFTGKANFDQVAGPIGIVSLVDNASNFGFIYLLGFTAFISLNLAVLNLIPFPALDGGRLLFVLIETITRRPINIKVANTLNLFGFLLLILLMIVITVSDVFKLF